MPILVNKTLKISVLVCLLFGVICLVIVRQRSLPRDIEFTDEGIVLYGKFKFEGEGDEFAVWDLNDKAYVTSGAVLTSVHKNYAFGYYATNFCAGSILVKNGSNEIKVSKIYFELLPSGKINFYLPDREDWFHGKAFSRDEIDFLAK